MAIMQRLRAYSLLRVQVDQREIGIFSGHKAPFLRQGKTFRHAFAR